MGKLQRFGADPGGAGPQNVIAPFTLVNNQATIKEMLVTLEAGADDTLFQLELSTDNFGGSIVEVARIELNVAGTMAVDLGEDGIRVTNGQSVRVRSTQGGVTGDHSASLLGSTTKDDIADI